MLHLATLVAVASYWAPLVKLISHPITSPSDADSGTVATVWHSCQKGRTVQVVFGRHGKAANT
jgi:hypothetical protein